jgi:hypothetical protein
MPCHPLFDFWWTKWHRSRVFSEFILILPATHFYTIAKFLYIITPWLLRSPDRATHRHNPPSLSEGFISHSKIGYLPSKGALFFIIWTDTYWCCCFTVLKITSLNIVMSSLRQFKNILSKSGRYPRSLHRCLPIATPVPQPTNNICHVDCTGNVFVSLFVEILGILILR